MQKFKRVLAFLLSLVMIVSSVNLTSVLTVNAAEDTETTEFVIENVAVNNSAATVTTNPSVSNGTRIIDGDTKYQYVTQGARGYIDMGGFTTQDENAYNYRDGSYILLDLGDTYLIDSLAIYDFEREVGVRDYIYDVSVSEDGETWVKVAEKPAGTGLYVMNFELPVQKYVARYVKMDNLKCKGANGFVMTELEVYGMPITDLDAVKSYLTVNNYCEVDITDSENPGYVQIDLGKNVALQEIMVSCYWGEAVRWYGYEIYTSADGENFDLLVSKDDSTTEAINGSNGFWFNAEGTSARYIRIVGTTMSKMLRTFIYVPFHVCEVQVYVTDADYTAVDEAIARADVLVREQYTSKQALDAVDAAVEAVVRGKNSAEQDEVDAMAQAINDAIDALVLRDADYTAVDIALAKVPEDMSIYTEESVKAVEDAVCLGKFFKKLS